MISRRMVPDLAPVDARLLVWTEMENDVCFHMWPGGKQMFVFQNIFAEDSSVQQ